MRVLFAGGGTGGHIYPALACAQALKKELGEKVEIVFVGAEGGLETKIIPGAGFPLQTVKIEGFNRSPGLQSVKAAFLSINALFHSIKILKDYSPDVVAGTGGYVSGPVLFAAFILRYPIVIQEQNIFPGVTNRILSYFADLILTADKEVSSYFPERVKNKIEVTGNPVRPEILSYTGPEGDNNCLDLEKNCFTLLVMGGSQGAEVINNNMLEIYEDLMSTMRLQVIHQTGRRGYDEVLKSLKRKKERLPLDTKIRVYPYIDDMAAALTAADLVVSRAGAMSLAEITAKGLPSILIPYPYAAHNHQEYNARLLEKKGASVVITEKDLTPDMLLNNILQIADSEKLLKKMEEASKNSANIDAVNRFKEAVLKLYC